jgi:hypothetical protein
MQLIAVDKRQYTKEQIRPTIQMLSFKQTPIKHFEASKQYEQNKQI